MKKIKAVFLTFAVLCIGWAATAHATTVRGEGHYVEKMLSQLAPFHAIDVRGNVQVDVGQQPQQQVSISGKQNLVALTDIRVENNTLIVDFKQPVHIKGTHALQVTVALPKVEALSVRNLGRVRIRGPFETESLRISASDNAYLAANSLKAQNLWVQALNKAEIDLEHITVQNLEAAIFDKAELELSGHAQTARLANNSQKDIEADNLRVAQAQVIVNDKGDIEVFATQQLNAQANGAGKIKYHGQPLITREGNLNKIKPAFED